ncbi:MAG: hypothetical protein HOM58_07155 [Rhodospirillaceae bacterium]|jgi:hypothetical protein|nr:hypothetical protein [Rhodospirillaceae bacterium]MBT5456374.1 hypothetical protein [Rhodospirillaceae bacterium]
MLTHSYSYTDCLDNAIKSAWTVDDCFQGRDFNFSKRFLPDRIAGVGDISCLDEDEKMKFNQIRGNSYCHIFAFVEEYIIPMVMDHARKDVYGDETRLRYLLQFAGDETKHQAMFKRAMDQIESGFGVSCGVIPGREAVAEVVLGKSPLTALLLTSLIEWFTQQHYLEHVREDSDLDVLFRDMLKSHWIDESQHAKADTLLVEEVADGMSMEDRETAIDELLELGMAIDGMLANQIEMDMESLTMATGRTFSDDQKEEIRTHQRRAYRWTFLVSGLEHPNFVRLVDELTNGGGHKIAGAARALAA